MSKEDRMKKEGFRLFLVISILCLCAGMANGQSSPNFQIKTDVLSGGGGPEGSANYDLDSVLGQSSAIGVSSSAHYVNHAGFWSAIPEVEPYIPAYVSKGVGCGGKVPCFNTLQNAIDSSESFTVLNVTQDTYAETISFNSPKYFSVRGGWDANFTDYLTNTVIQGSMTVGSGKVIIEYVTVR
jgi:hypothetical protein